MAPGGSGPWTGHGERGEDGRGEHGIIFSCLQRGRRQHTVRWHHNPGSSAVSAAQHLNYLSELYLQEACSLASAHSSASPRASGSVGQRRPAEWPGSELGARRSGVRFSRPGLPPSTFSAQETLPGPSLASLAVPLCWAGASRPGGSCLLPAARGLMAAVRPACMFSLCTRNGVLCDRYFPRG